MRSELACSLVKRVNAAIGTRNYQRRCTLALRHCNMAAIWQEYGICEDLGLKIFVACGELRMTTAPAAR